jgi:hypothetical protein
MFVGASAVAVAASIVLARPANRPEPVDLATTLRRAGTWVERFAEESVSIVGSEDYNQEYRPDTRSSGVVEARRLRSDIAVVRTSASEAGAGYPWVQFRDVIEVDGRSVSDRRGRLERLFTTPSGSSYAEAAALTAESARYNIGPGPRTVNVPLFALFFLVPANQGRFRFDALREEATATSRLAVIGFRERERPTMIRSPEGRNRPARGSFWIEQSGRVVRSRVEVESEGGWTAEMAVDFGHDAHVDAWVALSMHERHHRGDHETLDCTAVYSNYRRFSTGARIIDR